MARAAQSEYIPGTCNINFAEVAYRRKAFQLFLAITVVLMAILFATGIDQYIRVVVFIPAFIAILNYMQVKNRFCVTYAAAGEENAQANSPKARKIKNQDHIAQDKKRAKRMNTQATLVAAVFTAILMALPQIR